MRRLQSIGPADKEGDNFLRGAEPDLGFGLSKGGPDENTETAIASGPDNLKGSFVGDIVAEECNGGIRTLFIENGGCGAALVAAYAQLESCFEVEERKAGESCKRFKERTGAPLDALSGLVGLSAPVHDGAIGLVFKKATERVAAELLLELFEPGLGFGRSLLQLASSFGIEAFRSVETPCLERRVETKKRRDLMGGTARDDGHSGAALPLNTCECLADSGVGAGGEAIDPEGGERAVVIEQQNRTACRGKPCEESIEFFLRLRRHRLLTIL